jgi:hypothetical protein
MTDISHILPFEAFVVIVVFALGAIVCRAER